MATKQKQLEQFFMHVGAIACFVLCAWFAIFIVGGAYNGWSNNSLDTQVNKLESRLTMYYGDLYDINGRTNALQMRVAKLEQPCPRPTITVTLPEAVKFNGNGNFIWNDKDQDFTTTIPDKVIIQNENRR